MAFTDNFDGEGSDVDLASHVPSGGTAWTRVDGSSNMAIVTSGTQRLANNTSNTSGAFYRCDDQGSANHYVQYVVQSTNLQCFIVNRASARNSFIGVRTFGSPSKCQLYKCVSGTFTQLGSNGATTVSSGDTVRLESNGDNHEVFLNGVSQITATDAHNNTVTTQGVVARSSGLTAWADDFEAGIISSGVSGTVGFTNVVDTLSASGTTSIVGTTSYINLNDVLSSSGSSGLSVTGVVSYTNLNDVLTATGTTTIVGNISATDSNDFVSSSGWSEVISGTVTYTLNGDTITASGNTGGEYTGLGYRSVRRGLGVGSGSIRVRLGVTRFFS